LSPTFSHRPLPAFCHRPFVFRLSPAFCRHRPFVTGLFISERTRVDVKAAKGRGVKFGRKPKLTPQQIAHARKPINAGERREDVAPILNVDRTTLYRALAS
jgi:hypothetical protein